MRKLITILILLAIVMFFTRPSAEKHKLAIAKDIVKASQQGGLDSTAIVCWDFENRNAEFVKRAKENPEEAVKMAAEEVGKTLTVKDFWLCNVGTITRNGKKENVSLGAFGHVFCSMKN